MIDNPIRRGVISRARIGVVLTRLLTIQLGSTFVGCGRGSLHNNPTNFHFIVWISYFEFAVRDVGATMRPIASNAEFFLALKGLIYSWCDRRALNPLARVLGPYVVV